MKTHGTNSQDVEDSDSGTKQYDCESAWPISHSLRGSQIPKQAHKEIITFREIALSSLRKTSHCRPTSLSQGVHGAVAGVCSPTEQIPASQTEHQIKH